MKKPDDKISWKHSLCGFPMRYLQLIAYAETGPLELVTMSGTISRLIMRICFLAGTFGLWHQLP